MSVRQGNNTIAGATNYIPDLLDWKWADHLLDNISWLRGDTFSWQPGTVYVRVYSHLLSDITGKTLQTETVAGYTVSFYLADDGHKVCPADQESVVMSIFRRLGEAWYYILDTTNQRFKLPRKKDTSIKEIYNGTDGITILSNGLVIQKKPNRSGSEWFPNLNLVDTSRPVGASAASYGAAYAGERTMYFGTEWTGTEFISHARENYSGPSGTLYGATLISYATDEQISTFIGGKFVADGSEKYLYFYVGRFTQSSLEQTAGLNAELFNGKADVDLSNVSTTTRSGFLFSVSQESMSANNYYTLTFPNEIDPAKVKVNAYAVIKTANNNFAVGDVIPFESLWGQNYRPLSIRIKSTNLQFNTSDQISTNNPNNSGSGVNIVSYIRIVFDVYQVK